MIAPDHELVGDWGVREAACPYYESTDGAFEAMLAGALERVDAGAVAGGGAAA